MPILIDEKTCQTGCTVCDFFCPVGAIKVVFPPQMVQCQTEVRVRLEGRLEG